jgi:hypothetical protein
MVNTQAYSVEDVQALLAEALARQSNHRFTRPQVLEMAAELQVSPELFAQVEQDWRQRQQHQAREQARQQKRRQQFRQQLITYGAVNGGLLLLNIATVGAITWAIYPLLGWGLGLVLGAAHAIARADLNRQPSQFMTQCRKLGPPQGGRSHAGLLQAAQGLKNIGVSGGIVSGAVL